MMMKSALVVGSANCMESDIADAKKMFTPDIIVCCNRAGITYPGAFDHWATYHPNELPMWINERALAGQQIPDNLWTGWRKGKGVKPETPRGYTFRYVHCHGGSSGLLAATVALVEGCRRIVLAGIPISPEFKHFDNPNDWSEAELYRKGWTRRKFELEGTVKSMGGWTAELLGRPEASWLEGCNPPS